MALGVTLAALAMGTLYGATWTNETVGQLGDYWNWDTGSVPNDTEEAYFAATNIIVVQSQSSLTNKTICITKDGGTTIFDLATGTEYYGVDSAYIYGTAWSDVGSLVILSNGTLHVHNHFALGSEGGGTQVNRAMIVTGRDSALVTGGDDPQNWSDGWDISVGRGGYNNSLTVADGAKVQAFRVFGVGTCADGNNGYDN